MSAIALTSTQHNIFLVSDGRSANEATPDVTARTDSRKVWKVADNVGLAWIGYYPYKSIQEDLRDRLKESGEHSPKALAELADQFMDDTLTAAHYMKLQGPDRFRYCILVVGYQDGQPMIYQVDSEKEQIKAIPFPAGNNAFMGYDREVSDVERYAEALKRYQQLPVRHSPEMVVRSVFQDVINYWESKGKPVGGDIFDVTLQPKKKSKFKQALMN